MPKKPKNDDPNKVEKRWVEWSDLDNGVNLKAGHPVILYLGGVPATPGTSTTSGGPDATTTRSAEPGTTTTAPPSDTTEAPVAPSTTTQAPAGSTTQPPGTTTAPASTTTAQPAPTTTAQPAPTTTAQPTTTTTHAPSTTTTQGGKKYKTQLGPDHFDTAKAFPKPEDEAFATYRFVAKKANSTPGIQLLVLGHTDTQASDSYNLKLSDERAAAVKAYLINDVDSWYAYYSNADTQKKWGIKEDQYMLSALPRSDDGSLSDTPFYARDVNGVTNADYTAALKKFQGSVGEPATGTVNQATRKKLIKAYMAIEGTSIDDKTIVIQTKGCGFRNQAENPPTGANVASQKNRRTEIYGFEGQPVTPDVSAWDAANKSTNAPTYAEWQKSIDGDFTDS